MPQAPTVEIPKRLPLVTVPSNRGTSTNKDAKLVNCFAQKDDLGEFWIYKRPGLLTFQTQTGAGNGTYRWSGNTYSIFGGTVYKDGVAIVGAVDNTNGVYAFAETLGATPRLVFGNGVKAYTYDGTTLSQITDPNFPASFVKGWAYLDGTLYVMDASSNIWGSNLNDPTIWSALNKIIANAYAGNGVALTKQLVYVVAMKQWDTECFYDAANASGSPLAAAQNALIPWGCANSTSVQVADDVVYWLAINKSSELRIMILQNLQYQEISTKAINRLMDDIDYSIVYSWILQDMGYNLYGLTFPNSNLTLVYDISEGIWHQWTDASGNYFPMISSVAVPNLKHIFQHATNGKLYYTELSYTNDDGTIFSCDIVTPSYDGGTKRKKMLSRLEVIADQTSGSVLYIRRSDDDYQTWSNFRRVDLSKKHPRLENCGTFSKRAYHFRHRSNTSLRIKAVELQVDLCTL